MAKTTIRGSVIQEAVTATVEGMGEMGLTPAEAMTAAELIVWQFMDNAMRLAPNPEMLRQSKLLCTRVIMRLTSRVEAWPAKTTERN